jgi:Flp pilus assembly protein TadG
MNRRTRKQRGQGMVEFAMVIVVFMVIVTGLIDLGPVLFDLYTAKQMSARGARAASIYIPDGSRQCRTDVENAVGDPGLLMSTWSLSVSNNCSYDPYTAIAPGEAVLVTVDLTYVPMFWDATWDFQLSTVDQGR